MQVTRVLHVSVNVAGTLADNIDFYTDLLGLEGVDRPEIPGVDGRWFGVGDAQVHLVDAAMAGRGIDPTGPHFCVGVANLDAALAELDGRGIPYVRAVQGPDEIVQVWVTDPAGNTIELQADLGLPAAAPGHGAGTTEGGHDG